MQNRTIQFNINPDDTDTAGIRALEKANMITKKYNISDMSQDEINKEIAESRKSSDWYYFGMYEEINTMTIFVRFLA